MSVVFDEVETRIDQPTPAAQQATDDDESEAQAPEQNYRANKKHEERRTKRLYTD